MNSTVRSGFVFLWFLCIMSGAQAQAPELFKLVASDGANSDQFGSSVGIDQDLVAVGAPYDDDLGNASGSVYVFRFDGVSWVQEAKLTASDGAASDDFGRVVAVRNNRVLVGAHLEDTPGTSGGAAYLYAFNGAAWVEEAKLMASDGSAGDEFGCSVALAGDVAVIGAVKKDLSATDSGAAYVFRRHPVYGWLEERRLTASDAASSDQFGNAVAIEADWIAVGAQLNDLPGKGNAGSVYLFHDIGGTWSEVQQITASDAASSDYFGCSVSLGGGYLAVGAYRDDDLGSDSGSVYVFHDDGAGWVEQAKLVASDGAASDYFGYAVATTGSILLVGAHREDSNGSDAGSMYSFDRRGSAWAQDQKYVASDAATSDQNAIAVAVSGQRAVTGAPYENGAGSDRGAAYVLSVDEFVLTITPPAVNPGDKLTFHVRYGIPTTPVVLFVVTVNGSPFVQKVLRYVFASDHQFTLSATTPPGLSGLSVGFLGFKVDAFARIAGTNVATVQFN